MDEQIFLYVVMGSLAVVEIGLIVSIWKLKQTMDKWSYLFTTFDKKFQSIESAIINIYESIKHLDILKKGELRIEGSTPFGAVDLSIDLKRLLNGKDKSLIQNDKEKKE